MDSGCEYWCVICDRPLDDDEEMTCDGVCKQIMRAENTGFRQGHYLFAPPSVFAKKKWMPWSDLQVIPTDFDILDIDRQRKREIRRQDGH